MPHLSKVKVYFAVNNGNNGTLPFTFQALDIFDGNGNVQGTKGVTSIAGQVTSNQSFTGTYTVNSDCTVTFNFTDNSTGQKFAVYGVIFNNGNQISDMVTDQRQNFNRQCPLLVAAILFG